MRRPLAVAVPAAPAWRLRLTAKIAVAGAAVLLLAGCGTSAQNSSVTITGKSLTVFISAPAGYASQPDLAATVAGEQLAYRQHVSEVGNGFSVTLRTITSARLSDNARTAIRDGHAIAYLGEARPGDSELSAGITEAEDLLQVSPTDTALELTEHTPAVPGAPRSFYESLSSYGRTFARVVPNSASEARAQAAEMRQLGIRRLAVGDDGTDYGRAIAQAVRADASSAGIRVTADASAAGGAQGYFYGSASLTAAHGAFSVALGSNRSLTLFGPSGLADPKLPSLITPTPTKLYISLPGVATSALPSTGATLLAGFRTRYGVIGSWNALFGYESMDAVLGALHQAGRNAGNRTLVVKDFLAIRNRGDGVLPSYSIESGDTTLRSFVFLGLKRGALSQIATVTG